MIHTHTHTRRAFTLVELMVVVAVIIILAGAAYANFTRTRIRARDTNRKVGAESYAGAMQLYWQAKGNTYLVKDASGNGLGYGNEGWGRMTARSNGGTVAGYGATSIADSLFQQGYLAEVKTVPGITDLASELGQPALSLDTFHDYLLAVCDKDGSKATLTNGVAGEEFAVYTYLEVPNSTEETSIRSKCGGPESNNFWLQGPMTTGNL